MPKRRYKRKKKSYIFAYAVSFLFITLLLILFFSGAVKIDFSKIVTNTGSVANLTGTKKKVEQPKVYNNMELAGTGLVKQIPYNMQVATSYQLILSGKTFFAKSDNYLLGNYVNKNIQFSGIVVGFSPDNIPVLNITYINESKKQNEEDQSEERKNKYFNKDGLIINLENIPGDFQVCESGSVVYVCKVKQLSGSLASGNAFSGNALTGQEKIPYVKITFFKCNGNCQSTKKQFEKLGFNKFVNDNGVTFYKLPETDDYEVLNDEYGYYFKPLKQNIYFLINAFSLVDTKKLKLNVIKNTCQNDQIQLENILDIKSSGDVYNVVGVDTNANKVLCVLKISKSGNGYIGQLKKLDFLRDQQDTQDLKNLNENDYLVYTSRGFGYKVYMPKSVKYESDLINENFGISGLDCKQVVKISDWKTGKLSDPDVKVYYCKSELSPQLVEDGLGVNYQNFKVISKSNKMFIIFYKNTPIAKKILNYLKVY